MFLLRSPKYKLFAYALVFASFAHLRFIQTLTGRGDELVLAQGWLGISSRTIVALIVFLIGLPPIIAAFQVIENKRRMLVFIGSWLLPLPLLFMMLFGNQILFGSNGNTITGPLLYGIPLIVFITDLIPIILLIVFGRRQFSLQAEP
jgi:hypothetical protein